MIYRLHIDNFTPPSRTPWGGRVILDRIKAELPLTVDKRGYAVVGEAWEVSVEPSFPSRVTNIDGQPTLAERIEADRIGHLGGAVGRRYGGCPILVKLLDSAQNLSVQVHPSDDYAGLEPHQSGKPESWLVVDSKEGAGLYLGFRENVERDAVERALERGDDLEPLLNFVPVGPGDCFEIGPGTVHSIGAGVTLVEPQVVLPGRQGVTYRFWDWNRRYDAAGRLDPSGQPRQLHVADSLAVTDFDGPRGAAYVATLRRRPRDLPSPDGVRRQLMIDHPQYRVERIAGTSAVALEILPASLLAGVLVSGRLQCRAGSQTETFEGGESFAVPASAGPLSLTFDAAQLVLTEPVA